MEIGAIVFVLLCSFLVIYFSVSIAIKPLVDKNDYETNDNKEDSLVALRDMGIIDAKELEDIINLYKNQGMKKIAEERYGKFSKVLEELKTFNYIEEADYICKLDKLKKYFKIN